MRFALPSLAPVGRLLRSRRMRYGSNATVLTIATIGIVLLVNVLVSRHPGKIDLTQNKMYTLSEETRKVLSGLDRDVKITAFFPSGDVVGDMVADLLKEYTRLNSHIEVEFVDPDQDPSRAKRYEITAYGTSVVEAGGKSRKVMQYDLVEYLDDGQTTGFAGEQAFTRALIGVLQGEEKKVYFVAGHDERDLTGDYWQARSFLEGEGYSVDTLNLATAGKVPEDAALLVIAGPKKDLAAKEIEVLEGHLEKGGRLMVLADPQAKKGDLPNLRAMLARWGVAMRDDVVVDPKSHYFLDAASPVPEARYHDITNKLITEKLGTVLPRSRSLYESGSAEAAKLTVTALLVTSDESWGETDLQAERVAFDRKADAKGPLTLAYAVEHAAEQSSVDSEASEDSVGAGDSGPTAAPGAKLLVVGNASFLDDDVVTFQGNIDFFMNSVDWLVGKAESIAIRAKSPSYHQVYLTGGQASFVFYSTVVGLPLVFVAVGAGIWLRRRNL